MKTVGLAFATTLFATSAHAALTISHRSTKNISCTDGVCSATAADAVLNGTDLADILKISSVKLKSGSTAQDIVFDAFFSWTGSNALTLDSYRSITVNGLISDSGPGALTLTTNDGGSRGDLSFGSKGHIGFLSTSNSLTINKHKYALASSLAALAADANAKPSGFFALASDYNASVDGTYAGSPVANFGGTIQGLGNEISFLSIASDVKRGLVGLIGHNRGDVSNLKLPSAKVSATGAGAAVGALAGYNAGILFGDFAGGRVSGNTNSSVGGLVGGNTGIIRESASRVDVFGRKMSEVGGLVGANAGAISKSFATGAVREIDPLETHPADVGGLVGGNEGPSGIIDNSYAAGSVSSGGEAYTGGFVGLDQNSSISNSYSIGMVSTEGDRFIGGFAGAANSETGCYWDIDTSGTDQGIGGGNVSGIAGLTDAQLKAGLPAGFDPSIWARSPKINHGYPYLIDNPPPQ